MYTIPPGREVNSITIEESNPNAMHETGKMPMALNRLIKEYSRNPMPFKLIGIIEIKVMTGTKIRKYHKDTWIRRPFAMIHVTEMTNS